jgi:hypothetical protein
LAYDDISLWRGFSFVIAPASTMTSPTPTPTHTYVTLSFQLDSYWSGIVLFILMAMTISSSVWRLYLLNNGKCLLSPELIPFEHSIAFQPILPHVD